MGVAVTGSNCPEWALLWPFMGPSAAFWRVSAFPMQQIFSAGDAHLRVRYVGGSGAGSRSVRSL